MASMTKEISQKIISEYSDFENNSGSPQVQIAMLTYKVKWLTSHVQSNKKDFHSRLGLTKMVAKRHRLLKYLKKNNLTVYRELIVQLGIRG